MPERIGRMLRWISTAITNCGNQMVYHDWEKLYPISSCSATAFPEMLRQHFSAAVVDHGCSILFRDPNRYRTTKLPEHCNELGNPVQIRSISTSRRVFKGLKHIVLISETDITNFTLEHGDTAMETECTLFPIPLGTDLKPHLYCLLASFIQPSLKPDFNAEIERIRASLKKKYPEQYARFCELG
jgi:hypothetical protein